MKVSRPISLRDWRKRKNTTHTIESGTILPDFGELTDLQLEQVVGGMSTQKFEEWRAEFLREKYE